MQTKVESGKPIYRMSEAGRCARALSAQRLGYKAEPAPEWLERAADEGRWHEGRIKNYLANSGWDIHDEQKEVCLDDPTFILVGHIDGTINNIVDRTLKLIEIKSMSQYEFDRWMKTGFKGFPEYAAQLTCYMEATGLSEALYIVKNRSSGYEDRQVITQQPSSMIEIESKLMHVEEWVKKESLVSADYDPNSIECKRCTYKALCAPEPVQLKPFEERELQEAVKFWREGKRLIEQGQQFVDDARKIFEQHTKITGINKWRFGGLSIQLIEGERVTYPKSLLEQLVPEHLLEPVKKVEPYQQTRIVDLEKENARD